MKEYWLVIQEEVGADLTGVPDEFTAERIMKALGITPPNITAGAQQAGKGKRNA